MKANELATILLKYPLAEVTTQGCAIKEEDEPITLISHKPGSTILGSNAWITLYYGEVSVEAVEGAGEEIIWTDEECL